MEDKYENKSERLKMSTEDYKPAKQEKRLGRNERVTILNTDIDVLNVEDTVKLVEEYVKHKEPLHLIGVNADKINELNKNERLKQIVNSCGVINADGASVVMAGKFLGKPLPERVAGIDLMQKLVELSEEKGTVFIFLEQSRRLWRKRLKCSWKGIRVLKLQEYTTDILKKKTGLRFHRN